MREQEFRAWMMHMGTMQNRPIGDAISRCKRVCQALDIDLDEEFAKDGGISLLNELKYTSEDAKTNRPVDARFCFSQGANLKNGMASLKAAVKKYIEFCESVKEENVP